MTRLLTLSVMTLFMWVTAAGSQPIGPDGKGLKLNPDPVQGPKSIEVQVPLAKTTDPQPPAAILDGPKSVPLGSYIRVKTTGTVGDDAKIIIAPPLKNFDLVTFADGTFGVTGHVNEATTYYFFLAVNKNGKTAVTSLEVKVTEPEPGPAPNEYLVKLQAAYEKDGKPAEKKAYLTAIYKQIALEKAETWHELQLLLGKTVAASLQDNELRAVRDAVSDILTIKVPKDGPVNVNTQKKIFNDIADALQKVN